MMLHSWRPSVFSHQRGTIKRYFKKAMKKWKFDKLFLKTMQFSKYTSSMNSMKTSPYVSSILSNEEPVSKSLFVDYILYVTTALHFTYITLE